MWLRSLIPSLLHRRRRSQEDHFRSQQAQHRRAKGPHYLPTLEADVTASVITHNSAKGGLAMGGGTTGLGKGGGAYNLGTFGFDGTDVIDLNFASTSNDNIFPAALRMRCQ